MTRTAWIAFLVIVVLSGFAGTAEKDVKTWWPQFRGPNSSGVAEGGAPVRFGPDQKVLWKTAVASGLSSPTVWDQRIFLTEFDQPNKQLQRNRGARPTCHRQLGCGRNLNLHLQPHFSFAAMLSDYTLKVASLSTEGTQQVLELHKVVGRMQYG